MRAGIDAIPWGAVYSDVIWCEGDALTRRAAFNARIERGDTHIVREVGCTDYDPVAKKEIHPANPDEAQDLIDRAQLEFSLLSVCGVQIPEDIKWHIFRDTHTGFTRTLARVPVIEGISLEVKMGDDYVLHNFFKASTSLLDKHIKSIARYTSIPGKRLWDVTDHSQYIYGHPRGSVDKAPGFYLVDIEPLF